MLHVLNTTNTQHNKLSIYRQFPTNIHYPKNTANKALCSYWLVRLMYCILIGWLDYFTVNKALFMSNKGGSSFHTTQFTIIW